jgi:hypothetical protein
VPCNVSKLVMRGSALELELQPKADVLVPGGVPPRL